MWKNKYKQMESPCEHLETELYVFQKEKYKAREQRRSKKARLMESITQMGQIISTHSMCTKISKAILTICQKLNHYAPMFVLEQVPSSLWAVHSTIYCDPSRFVEDEELIRDLRGRLAYLDVNEMSGCCGEARLPVQNVRKWIGSRFIKGILPGMLTEIISKNSSFQYVHFRSVQEDHLRFVMRTCAIPSLYRLWCLSSSILVVESVP